MQLVPSLTDTDIKWLAVCLSKKDLTKADLLLMDAQKLPNRVNNFWYDTPDRNHFYIKDIMSLKRKLRAYAKTQR